MKIIVADDKKLERHNLIEKLIRIFSVPLLNILPPSVVQKMMSVSSRDAKAVIKQGGSTHALKVMYGRYSRSLFSRGFLQGFADLFWHHCVSQPKALRNRLKIVENNLYKEILKLASNQRNITILTIGGGSGRGIVQSLNRFQKKNLDCKIKIINIDKSQKAIDLSKKITKEANLHDNFEWIKDDARNIKFLVSKNSVDIVEMVGLLDYFSDEKGVEVIKQVYDVLKQKGLFIVGNVYPNVEMPFIRRSGWPEMYYRMPEDLSRILINSGFSENKGEIIFEPLKFHIIVLIRK